MNRLTHLGRELLLIGLVAPDELKVKTLSQYATSAIDGKPKPTCQQCKKPGHCEKNSHQKGK